MSRVVYRKPVVPENVRVYHLRLRTHVRLRTLRKVSWNHSRIDVSRGGATILIDNSTGDYTVALCHVEDQFSRPNGIRIALGRFLSHSRRPGVTNSMLDNVRDLTLNVDAWDMTGTKMTLPVLLDMLQSWLDRRGMLRKTRFDMLKPNYFLGSCRDEARPGEDESKDPAVNPDAPSGETLR